ncbi:stretch-activated cation channel Mid1p [Trichomonascus vanleenenianus]|uniref:Mid1p n=1 Tax=Trichomonascus vanleenenianus TaxID=2268995 RepID=UPI003EC9544E
MKFRVIWAILLVAFNVLALQSDESRKSIFYRAGRDFLRALDVRSLAIQGQVIEEKKAKAVQPTSVQPVSSETTNTYWEKPTRVEGKAPSATATPIKQDAPVRYTIKSGQTHRYELTNITASGNLDVFVTLNVCQEPPVGSLQAPEQPLSIFAGINSTGTMYGMNTFMGFANVTLYNVSSSSAVAEISTPVKNNGQWTYEIGMSTVAPVHGVGMGPNLYLVDTDFANALFVTGNFTPNAEGQMGNVSEYDIYAYPFKFSAPQDTFMRMPSIRLGASYCAVSTGPALINTNNTQPGETRRGYGNRLKGQFYMRGLNRSTSYVSYLTQPNINMQGGVVYQPVYFASKSETNCQVIFDLDFCSELAYAVPGNASAFTAPALARIYDKMARNLYRNFTYSLENVACNASADTRYSMVRDCDDCANSYKQWLCAVTIPRCTDWTLDQSFLFPRPAGTSRNPMINHFIRPGPYKEILPCADLCYGIVQDCAPSFGFQCPKKGQGLESSYGFYSDNGYVSCSYPGAVYFLNGSSRLTIGFFWVVLAALVALLM